MTIIVKKMFQIVSAAVWLKYEVASFFNWILLVFTFFLLWA